jgi:hypothetical protein
VQFAGAQVSKRGKEKPGANKKQTLTGPVKVSCHTIWTDLIAARVGPADIDGNLQLCCLPYVRTFLLNRSSIPNTRRGKQTGR